MTAHRIRQHWFFLAAPLVLATDLSVAVYARGSIDRTLEAGLLFDLVVLIPCLYWLCYRHRGRAALTRAAALACLGIWFALKLVPEPEQDLLFYVAPLRYVGLAALLWLELVVVVSIYRTVFKGGAVSDAVARAPVDMPPWLARLLALEARFWLKLWHFLRRVVGKR